MLGGGSSVGKARVRFTGRDAVVALLGASSLLLFSHLFALRPSVFLLPAVHIDNQQSHRPQQPYSPTLPPHDAALGPTPLDRLIITPPPAEGVTPTTLLSHAAGWTLFTNLYLSNGTWFVVSDQGGEGGAYWPQRRIILSTGLPGYHTNIAEREPTDKDMSWITVDDAKRRWGDRVWDIEGFSLIANDPDQFLKHYYHVAAELLFGTERVLTNFDPMPAPDGRVTAPRPDRIIFPHCSEEGFMDVPRFNQFFLPAMWPSITPMFETTFKELSSLVRESHKAYRFPAALFIDRSAAHHGDPTGSTARTPAGPWAAGGGFHGTGGQGRNRFWYESARRRVGQFAGVPQSVLDIGIRALDTNPEKPREAPVVTYISRQKSRRRLLEEDHKKLVEELESMCKRIGCVLDVVHAELLSREEQLRRAARTVVLVGVHGNGLTHQIMMPPHPASTVVEIFYPGGFARDYEWTAGVLGKAYYGVQNDTFVAPPVLPDVSYPEGFHGSQIPVQASLVVKLVEDRLEGRAGLQHWSGHEGVGY